MDHDTGKEVTGADRAFTRPTEAELPRPEKHRDASHQIREALQEHYAKLVQQHAQYTIDGDEVVTTYPPEIQEDIEFLAEEIAKLEGDEEMESKGIKIPETIGGETFSAILEMLPNYIQDPLNTILAGRELRELSDEEITNLQNVYKQIYKSNTETFKAAFVSLGIDIEGISDNDYYANQKKRETKLKPVLDELKTRIWSEPRLRSDRKRQEEKREMLAPFLQEYSELTEMQILQEQGRLLQRLREIEKQLDDEDNSINMARSEEQYQEAKATKEALSPEFFTTKERLEAIQIIIDRKNT